MHRTAAPRPGFGCGGAIERPIGSRRSFPPAVGDLTMSPREKILSKLGLGISIPGVVWALFILFATGMSNVPDEARRQTFLAFPPAVLGFALSISALALACNRGTVLTCAVPAGFGVAVSGGTISLIIVALRSYP